MNLETAIHRRLIIEFTYDGLPRVAQPATLGTTRTGKESLRACLVGGASRTNSIPCWELYTVAKILDLRVTGTSFSTFAVADYTRGDYAFAAISAEH
jgi:hypothetical protein